jgi:uncharacterized membrane protein (DUF485 family)
MNRKLRRKIPKIEYPKTIINLKYYVVFVGIFGFKPAGQFVGRHHSVVDCALNMKDVISKSFCKFSK